MRLVRRISVLLTAYVLASIGAALTLLMVSMVSSDNRQELELGDVMASVGVVSVLAGTFASPLALPVIVYTELRKAGSVIVFLTAAAIFGLLLSVVFTPSPNSLIEPNQWVEFGRSATLFFASILAALIFWFVAWRVWPPRGPVVIQGGSS